MLHVRTVTGEYLIAMKLRAGRRYKNDLSDVVGILAEHERVGKPITYEMIDRAVRNLYGSWEKFSQDSISFIREILAAKDYEEIYSRIRDSEVQAKTTLLDFQETYPGVMTEENVKGILDVKQQKRASVLAQLNERKKQRREVE